MEISGNTFGKECSAGSEIKIGLAIGGECNCVGLPLRLCPNNITGSQFLSFFKENIHT